MFVSQNVAKLDLLFNILSEYIKVNIDKPINNRNN